MESWLESQLTRIRSVARNESVDTMMQWVVCSQGVATIIGAITRNLTCSEGFGVIGPTKGRSSLVSASEPSISVHEIRSLIIARLILYEPPICSVRLVGVLRCCKRFSSENGRLREKVWRMWLCFRHMVGKVGKRQAGEITSRRSGHNFLRVVDSPREPERRIETRFFCLYCSDVLLLVTLYTKTDVSPPPPSCIFRLRTIPSLAIGSVFTATSYFGNSSELVGP